MTELSVDYLKAFHKFVTGHAMIFDQVKAEIHKRARGSAGGTAKAKRALEGGGEEIDLEDITEHLLGESPVKVTNAAYVDGDIIETDEYYDVPTVFAKEGVWTGTNGIPTLKTFEALKASAPWFVGTPITPKHIETDTIRPDDRRLGHVISATAREDKRDVFGISRLYKNLLTSEENEKVANRQNLDGSPGYFTPVRSETGIFGDKQYQAKEIGPYVLGEYAMFFDGTHGACSSADNCGPFQNAKGKKKDPIEELIKAPPSLELDENGNVRRRDCKKQKNEADQMTEDIAALKAEFEKQLNAAKEIITGQAGAIEALTTKLEGLATEHKTLNEAFKGKVVAEDAAKDATQKEEFKKKNLNAAAATDIDKIWLEVKGMNPTEFDAWKITNSAKLLTEAEKKAAIGKKTTNAAGDLVASSRAKADAALFKRR